MSINDVTPHLISAQAVGMAYTDANWSSGYIDQFQLVLISLAFIRDFLTKYKNYFQGYLSP